MSTEYSCRCLTPIAGYCPIASEPNASGGIASGLPDPGGCQAATMQASAAAAACRYRNSCGPADRLTSPLIRESWTGPCQPGAETTSLPSTSKKLQSWLDVKNR